MSAATDTKAKNSRPVSNKPHPHKGQSVSVNGNKLGRPSGYDQDMADRICQHVANGGFVSQLQTLGLPSHTTIGRWLNENEDFRSAFARAREQRAETFADQIVEIADTEEDPNRARVRVDARKFVAAKLLPRIYGDNQRVEVEHGVSQTAARVLMELTQRAKERQAIEAPMIDVTPAESKCKSKRDAFDAD